MTENTMITDIEVYFTKGCGRCSRFATAACSTRRWADGLLELRRICRAEGLVETVKWGHPCYTHYDRNIAMIGAFKGDYCLTFFNAALMKDPESLLRKRGENTQTASVIYLTDNGDAAKLEPIIAVYLQEAIGYAKAGIKPVKVAVELDVPDELVDALDSDPELAEAYEALTPGRQKSYIFALKSAKTSATRVNRIAKFRDKIMAGKGALDR